jgi:hypothetical protein
MDARTLDETWAVSPEFRDGTRGVAKRESPAKSVASASSSESLQLALALFRRSRQAQEPGNRPVW